MNLSKFQCVKCQQSAWTTDSTTWKCEHCGQTYECVSGIPRLYLESSLGDKDRKLRESLYNGFLGKYYQYVMPFLSLPARPARISWKGWLVHAASSAALLLLTGFLAYRLFWLHSFGVLEIVLLAIFALITFFFIKHPYLFFLLLLAVPVKISAVMRTFKPAKTFPDIHADLIQKLMSRNDKLQVLDISTGTCNSLYRHGWMKLNAEYTGLDLSETMLLQGQALMAQRGVPMDFALGDATNLPFTSESFDVVLNYGALNGYADSKKALEEMARVVKKGGLVLVLDEQLYPEATIFERWYFKRVLSSHDVIDRCPVEWIPPSLEQLKVHQVYRFYYLCTAWRKC
jgi:hypothetical protein